MLDDWEPELLLCGLPYTMAGEEGPQAQRIRKVASQVSAACGIPHEFTDERLSSSEAKRSLREKGYDEKSHARKNRYDSREFVPAGVARRACLEASRKVISWVLTAER